MSSRHSPHSTHLRGWYLAVLASIILALPGIALASNETAKLTLTGQAERQVANDEMTVLMTAGARAPEAASAAATVNRNMKAALEQAAKYEVIEARTIGYSTRAIHDPDDRSHIQAWQVEQNLELTSGDFEALTELAGALQQGELTISQIRFSLSREARQAHREDMLETAIADLQAQARVIARSLGSRQLRTEEIELLDDHYDRPQPMMAMRAMDESASQPALEAGHSTLSLRVRGTLQALGAATLDVEPR
ncbi:SIMPL domain-containing protein [Thioalkalivibrio sp. ALJ1]|uniref:SIMPL domain-containing protein n=1 Tax=Thioalkalivibrio sp. ALJ1 TaxID=1158144 RepID=UPI00056FB4F4|nr:SIMPL domain-containing protein [Thioalkalivibrio sp. ALJ1]